VDARIKHAIQAIEVLQIEVFRIEVVHEIVRSQPGDPTNRRPVIVSTSAQMSASIVDND
jgi:hypothetical protein